LIELTIVSVWPLLLPVRGSEETILIVPLNWPGAAAAGDAAGLAAGEAAGEAAGLAAGEAAGFGASVGFAGAAVGDGVGPAQAARKNASAVSADKLSQNGALRVVPARGGRFAGRTTLLIDTSLILRWRRPEKPWAAPH